MVVQILIAFIQSDTMEMTEFCRNMQGHVKF